MTRFLTALPGQGCVRAWKFRVTDREHKPVLQQLDGRHHFEITSICFVIFHLFLGCLTLPIAALKGKWKIHLSQKETK